MLGRWLMSMSAVFALAADAVLAADHPNIVFILADDLGYTDVGCYGSGYYRTPRIDRMATEGMRFTDGHTCGPNCQPTRAALMSGQYGPRTGVYTVGDIDRFDWPSRPLRPVDNVTELSPDTVTVAESLRVAGYTTGMFGKWHLGNDAAHHPSAQGFDEAIVSQGEHFQFATNPHVDHPPEEYLADFLTDRATDFIRRHQSEPFFLYVPHFGVHSPHEAKPELIESFRETPPAGGHGNPTYAAMIASVDESVGRILDLLDELQLSERTLVIYSSDNGGVGGYERIGIHADGPTDNAPLKGGKGTLYEGGHRVPYIFRWPGTIPAGGENATPIISVDLYPTLLEVAGAAAPEGQILDGTSYLSILRGAPAGERPPLYWHFPGYLGASQNTWRTTPCSVIRSGDWKLLQYFEDGHLELYNLHSDLGEERNLAASEPERTAALLAQLQNWRDEIGAPLPTPNKPQAPGTARRRNRRAADE
ncbi:MAG: sulfatase [Planctomycetaceae bacterium]|nr:sulfatase [Planctomycetaceae bacterium]